MLKACCQVFLFLPLFLAWKDLVRDESMVEGGIRIGDTSADGHGFSPVL